MKVAIARVKDVGDPELIPGADVLNLGQYAWQLASGDRRILNKEVGGDASHGTERLFAGEPHGLAVFGGPGETNVTGPVCHAERASSVKGLVQPGLDPIEFHHQRRSCVRRESCREDGGFDGTDGFLVDDFEGSGEESLRHDGGDGTPRIRHRGKDPEEGTGSLWRWDEGHLDFDCQSEAALRADKRPEQVEFAERLGAPELHERSVWERDAKGGHIARGDPVLEAMGASGVFGHIAAEGAGTLGGWIRGVDEAVGEGRPGQVRVDDPGLDPRTAVDGVHREDAIHARGAHKNAAVGGECTSRETGSGAAGDDGDSR